MSKLPASLKAQSRPDPATISPAAKQSDPVAVPSYLSAQQAYESAQAASAKESLLPPVPDLPADVVASSMLGFLESVSEDEGGNAARYFPAVLLSRMAKRVAEDANTYIALNYAVA